MGVSFFYNELLYLVKKESFLKRHLVVKFFAPYSAWGGNCLFHKNFCKAYTIFKDSRSKKNKNAHLVKKYQKKNSLYNL